HGIRNRYVTGVQTCALPIWAPGPAPGPAPGQARGPAPGQARGPAPGQARGRAQYRPRPNRRERSGCLPGCYRRQPRGRCRGCGSSSRLRFENLHERLGVVNADSELSLTADSDKVVLPQRGQAGAVLGGGQVQRRLIGNVVADAADLAPEDLREVTQVPEGVSLLDMGGDRDRATDHTTTTGHVVGLGVGGLHKQRTTVEIDRAVDDRLSDQVQKTAGELL